MLNSDELKNKVKIYNKFLNPEKLTVNESKKIQFFKTEDRHSEEHLQMIPSK